MFDYNVDMETNPNHPAMKWEHDANQPQQSAINKLRMAAMAGHMRVDKLAARRAALIDLLADGCPHPREEIWETIATHLTGSLLKPFANYPYQKKINGHLLLRIFETEQILMHG
jgi:hypothetical protein